jgi:hypothetical protein
MMLIVPVHKTVHRQARNNPALRAEIVAAATQSFQECGIPDAQPHLVKVLDHMKINNCRYFTYEGEQLDLYDFVGYRFTAH